jgi:ribonuclease Z
MGFRIDEKPREPNVSKEAIEKYNLGVEQIKLIKEGADITLENGTTLLNKDLVLEPLPLRSYAYCSDTAFAPEMIPFIENATMLSTIWQMGADYIQGYYFQEPSEQMNYDFSSDE